MDSKIRTKYAKLSPNQLLSGRFFSYWLQFQKPFIFVLIIAVIIVFLFARYTYNPFDSYASSLSNLFNLSIHAIGIFGVITTAKAIATVEIEKGIANKIRIEGEDYLRLLKSGQGSRLDLSKMEETFLGDKIKPTLAMPRLFRHICKEAENLKFESSLDVIEPYRDESIESIFAITNIQKLALRAGILGTFIGLLEAISQLAKTQENPLEVISNLSASLFISFSTSVAGLEVAILLGVLIMLLRKQQDVYFRDMETSVEVILSSVRNANNDNQSFILGELAQLSGLIEQLGIKIYEHTKEVKLSINVAQTRMNEQTNVIEKGIQQLKQAKSEFDEFIGEVSQVQKNFIGEVTTVYHQLSLKEFQDGIQNSIISAGNNVSHSVRQTEDSLQEHTLQIQKGIDEIIQTRSRFVHFLEEIDSSQEKFIERVKSAQDTVSMVEVSTELRTTINRAVKELENASSTMSRINRSLNRPFLEKIRNYFLLR